MESGFFLTTCAILVPGILWAAWIDFRQRRVPNWLNAALAAMGIMAQIQFNGWQGLTTGMMGLAVGFGLLFVPWLMHGMGAGDVKLMMAIGIWIGPWMTFYAFCVGVLIGGVIAMVMILYTGRLWNAYCNLCTIANKVTNRSMIFTEFGSSKSFGTTSQLLPYGVPLTFGTLMVLLGQSWLPSY